MKNNYNIACIILNYNDYITVCQLIRKIKNYTIFNYIIIIDNCSTDGSYDKLLKLQDKRIIVRLNTINAGYGAGNNCGIKIAREEYHCNIAIIANPDVIFREKTIVRIVNVLKKNNNCAVSAPIQLKADGSVVGNYAWNVPGYWRYTLSSLYFIRKILPKYNIPSSQTESLVECVPGALLGINIELFLEVGGFDERVFLYGEETILGFKLKSKQYETILIKDESYIHNHGVTITKSIPSTIKRKKLLLNSRLFFIEHYLNVPRYKIYFTKFFYKISIIEEYVKSILRICLKQHRH